MSKKTRQKAMQAKLEPPPPAASSTSFTVLWRRHGLWIAGGLFVLANVALRLMDTKVLEPTAFSLIAALTILSIALAGGYGLQLWQTSRRASLEGWTKLEWERWRNGQR